MHTRKYGSEIAPLCKETFLETCVSFMTVQLSYAFMLKEGNYLLLK